MTNNIYTLITFNAVRGYIQNFPIIMLDIYYNGNIQHCKTKYWKRN